MADRESDLAVLESWRTERMRSFMEHPGAKELAKVSDGVSLAMIKGRVQNGQYATVGDLATDLHSMFALYRQRLGHHESIEKLEAFAAKLVGSNRWKKSTKRKRGEEEYEGEQSGEHVDGDAGLHNGASHAHERGDGEEEFDTSAGSKEKNQLLRNGTSAGIWAKMTKGKKMEYMEKIWAIAETDKTRPRMFFVKYKGYPEAYNEWVHLTDVPKYLETFFYSANRDLRRRIEDGLAVCATLGDVAKNFCVYCPNYIFQDETHLECSACHTKGHARCFLLEQGYTEECLKRCMARDNWECANCLRCQKCGQDTDPASLIICDGCDVANHSRCIGQAVPSDDKKFFCLDCRSEGACSASESQGGAADSPQSSAAVSVRDSSPEPMEVTVTMVDDILVEQFAHSPDPVRGISPAPAAHHHHHRRAPIQNVTEARRVVSAPAAAGHHNIIQHHAARRASPAPGQRAGSPALVQQIAHRASPALGQQAAQQASPAPEHQASSPALGMQVASRHSPALSRRHFMEEQLNNITDQIQGQSLPPTQETLASVRQQRDHAVFLLRSVLAAFVPNSAINSLTDKELYLIQPHHLAGLGRVADEEDVDEGAKTW